MEISDSTRSWLNAIALHTYRSRHDSVGSVGLSHRCAYIVYDQPALVSIVFSRHLAFLFQLGFRLVPAWRSCNRPLRARSIISFLAEIQWYSDWTALIESSIAPRRVQQYTIRTETPPKSFVCVCERSRKPI